MGRSYRRQGSGRQRQRRRRTRNPATRDASGRSAGRRQIAQYTRGKFIFIEYGSTAAAAASHGVGGKVASNNLDDIIFEQIRDEIAKWGRA